VPLAKDAKSPVVEASPDNAYSGKYPLARFLYIYVNLKPGDRLDPLRTRVPPLRPLAARARKTSSRTATSRSPAIRDDGLRDDRRRGARRPSRRRRKP
jgi:hypothetical protein